jgi:branched-subunit amino acid ABC-type transport system permease component
MGADQIINLLLSMALGVSLLVIVSIGLAVIFGMMGIINLAHGEFLMLGAYFTLTGVRAGLNLWVSMFLAALAVGLFGLVIERLLIHHLYGRLAASMLATWGLSLILAQGVALVFGPTTQGIATPLGSFRIGAYSFSEYSLVLIATSVLLLALVYWVFTRTRYGTMARAATQLPHMAAAVGVNTRIINMWTFGFGAALAGAGGALLAPLAGVVPTMGQAYIARAFMTVIVGGAGVLTGTSAASGLLGSIEYAVSYLTNPFLGQGALLVLAIVLLRVMPTGLSGAWGRQL